MTTLGELEVNQKDLKVQWKVKNFFSLIEEVYSSGIFSFANQSWCLRLYPNGNKYDRSYAEGCISMYLRRKSPGLPIKIEFSFSLKTVDKKKILKTRHTRDFLTSEIGEGAGKFLERSELLDRKSELMPSDVLTVVCFLRCPRSTKDGSTFSATNSEDMDSSESELSSDEDDKGKRIRSSKIKGMEILSENLKQVLLEGLMCDAVLKADGKDFNVHKVIMVARSPVFASMFQHDLTEKSTNEVCIPDCTAESFESFLHYLYTGSTETLSTSNVYNVYYAADKYQVHDLKEKCVKFMMKNISVETFCDVMELSVRHDEAELLKDATDFFCQNVKDIIRTVRWLTYMEANTMQANELFIKVHKA